MRSAGPSFEGDVDESMPLKFSPSPLRVSTDSNVSTNSGSARVSRKRDILADREDQQLTGQAGFAMHPDRLHSR